MSKPAHKVCNPPRRIGLISDTHGLIRAEALAALGDSDLIIHAGDIGKPEVLAALKTLAPVIAIKGNNDLGRWADRLPDVKMMAFKAASFYLIHNVRELDFDPAARGIGVVISGHSHQPSIHTRGGVLFVNPGSAGPRRFKLPICVGKLVFRGRRIAVKIVELS